MKKRRLYRDYRKVYSIIRYPNRVKKFKKPKWGKLQKFIKKKHYIQRRRFFKRFFYKFVPVHNVHVTLLDRQQTIKELLM